MRPLLFRRLLSPHPVPPYAGEFFGAAFPGSSRLPWPSPSLTSSALPCSPLGANLSTLLPVHRTGVHLMLRAAVLLSFLRRSRTLCVRPTLQHLRSPRSTGCLLRGGLTLTATGLSPASRRQLIRTHQPVVGRLCVSATLHACLLQHLVVSRDISQCHWQVNSIRHANPEYRNTYLVITFCSAVESFVSTYLVQAGFRCAKLHNFIVVIPTRRVS